MSIRIVWMYRWMASSICSPIHPCLIPRYQAVGTRFVSAIYQPSLSQPASQPIAHAPVLVLVLLLLRTAAAVTTTVVIV
ncbi:hypothetical protein IWX92DRAFT_377611 [Phyllosticta citricarpa]